MELKSAAPEPLVRFLYPVLNGLISLITRPNLSIEVAALGQQSAFATMAHIVKYIQFQLNLPSDKHEHNTLLATYLQHVLIVPTGRDRPIMLIILPIMLCCSAHKIYLLCSKLCSRIELCLVYYHYLYRNLHE